MANVTIKLVVDPVTRKRNVIISYESDSSALPIEHEEEHRRIVNQLIEGGAIKAGELGKIVVEREQEKEPAGSVEQGQGESQRQSVKQKG